MKTHFYAALIMLMLILGAERQIFAQDLFQVRQLTTDPAQEGFPTWSPDGKKIAFNSTRGQNADIWVMDLDIEEVWKKLKEADSNK
jgi:Tol biopolymer transport system component